MFSPSIHLFFVLKISSTLKKIINNLKNIIIRYYYLDFKYEDKKSPNKAYNNDKIHIIVVVHAYKIIVRALVSLYIQFDCINIDQPAVGKILQ